MAADFGWNWDTALSGLGALGTVGGLAASGFNIANMMSQQRQADRFRRQMAEMANAPVDWRQFYNPMNEAEKTAFGRSLKADYASRGVPLDSAVASNMLSQRMSETEGARMGAAQDRGIQSRGAQMQGFGAARPQFGPMLPADMSSIFKYFGSRPQDDPSKKTGQTQPGVGAAAPNAAAIFAGDPSIYGGEFDEAYGPAYMGGLQGQGQQPTTYPWGNAPAREVGPQQNPYGRPDVTHGSPFQPWWKRQPAGWSGYPGLDDPYEGMY